VRKHKTQGKKKKKKSSVADGGGVEAGENKESSLNTGLTHLETNRYRALNVLSKHPYHIHQAVTQGEKGESPLLLLSTARGQQKQSLAGHYKATERCGFAVSEEERKPITAERQDHEVKIKLLGGEGGVTGSPFLQQ